MKNSKLLTVKVGEQKFFVSDRGLVLGDEQANQKPPPGSQIDRAIHALAGVEKTSFEITPLADVANSIRKRWGFFSQGALIIALDRLGVSLRLASTGELLAGVSRDWIRKQWAVGNVYQRQILRASRKRADASRGYRMTQEASGSSSDAYQCDRGLQIDPIPVGVDPKGFEHERY